MCQSDALYWSSSKVCSNWGGVDLPVDLMCQVWCNGIQGIYAQLTGGRCAKFGVTVFKASMLNWGVDLPSLV